MKVRSLTRKPVVGSSVEPSTRGHASLSRSPAARLGVRTKLRVGTPGDRYEREADDVADRVNRGQDAPDISRIPASGLGAQRQEDGSEAQMVQREPDTEGSADPTEAQTQSDDAQTTSDSDSDTQPQSDDSDAQTQREGDDEAQTQRDSDDEAQTQPDDAKVQRRAGGGEESAAFELGLGGQAPLVQQQEDDSGSSEESEAQTLAQREAAGGEQSSCSGPENQASGQQEGGEAGGATAEDPCTDLSTQGGEAPSPTPVQAKCAGCEGAQRATDDVQAKCASCSAKQQRERHRKGPRDLDVGSTVQARLERAKRAGGERLPASVRADFEPRFGRDLSHVQIHRGAEAAALSKALRARAFTSGANVFFAPGEYSPDSPRGRHLLAHELTHTVQQGSSTDASKDELAPTAPADSEHRATGRTVSLTSPGTDERS